MKNNGVQIIIRLLILVGLIGAVSGCVPNQGKAVKASGDRNLSRSGETDLSKFPKTFWIGIDDGHPSKQSNAHKYLIDPVVKKFSQDKNNDGWALKPLVNQFFTDNPADKSMLNLCESLKGISLLKDGTAIGFFRLRNARHFEIKYEGYKDIAVFISLSWIVLGSEKNATRIGVAPEIRLARTAFAFKTTTVKITDQPDMPALYQDAFFTALTQLMDEVRNSSLADTKTRQIPVMIEKMSLGRKTTKFINELIGEEFASAGEAAARQHFIEDLTFYLQKGLINTLRQNPALNKISLLPPKGPWIFYKMNGRTICIVWRTWGIPMKAACPNPSSKKSAMPVSTMKGSTFPVRDKCPEK